MGKLPDIQRGQRWAQQNSREWRDLVEQVAATMNLSVGPGLQIRKSSTGIQITLNQEPPDILDHDRTVVITQKPVEGNALLTVREAKYTDVPPLPCTGAAPNVVCHYRFVGPEFVVYPPMGTKPIDFEGDEYVGGSDDPPVDPKLSTVFHRVYREHGVWVIDKLGGGSVIQQFRVVGFSGFPNTITCKTWDGVTLGTDTVQIAKPFTLRRKPFEGFVWNGITYSFQSNIERTAIKTIPGNPPTEQTEKQVIVPAYTMNQTIYAAKDVVGGVGATYDDEAGVAQNAVWVDLNVDGRSWAKKA